MHLLNKPVKIVSWNVNGIRSAYFSGLGEYIKSNQPDIICLQEIKANENDIPDEIRNPAGYRSYFNSAIKKGYAGTALYYKDNISKSVDIKTDIGFDDFDKSGRIIRVDFRDFTLINVYMPHGGRFKEKLGFKIESYQNLFKYLSKINRQNVILVGDFNIAHSEIDLARPKQNINNIMFTRQERDMLDELIGLGYTDVFRKYCSVPGYYTWWSYAHDARIKNIGWRIDYIFACGQILNQVKSINILKSVTGSDHCPVMLELSDDYGI